MAKSSRVKQSTDLPAECPICRYQFGTGILGWDKHIGTYDKHPRWHPELTSPADRQAAFAQEFPEFFKGALTPSRRKPLQARANPPVASETVARGTTTPATPAALSAAPVIEHGQLRCPTCGAPLTYSQRPGD